MQCDPSRASFKQFEVQYQFRYYSSLSQPHCFLIRLNVLQLAIASGPPSYLLGNDACLTDVCDELSVSRLIVTQSLPLPPSQARLQPSQCTALSFGPSICPPSPEGVTACMASSAVVGLIARNEITCHPHFEVERDDRRVRGRLQTEVFSCICMWSFALLDATTECFLSSEGVSDNVESRARLWPPTGRQAETSAT